MNADAAGSGHDARIVVEEVDATDERQADAGAQADQARQRAEQED